MRLLLPEEVKNASSLQVFKNKLEEWKEMETKKLSV